MRSPAPWLLSLAALAFPQEAAQDTPQEAVREAQQQYARFLSASALGRKEDLGALIVDDAAYESTAERNRCARGDPLEERLDLALEEFTELQVDERLLIARVIRRWSGPAPERAAEHDAVVVLMRRGEDESWRVADQLVFESRIERDESGEFFSDYLLEDIPLDDTWKFSDLLRSNYETFLAAKLYSNRDLADDVLAPGSPFRDHPGGIPVAGREDRGGYVKVVGFDFLQCAGEWAFVHSDVWTAMGAQGVVETFGGPLRLHERAVLVFRRVSLYDWKLYGTCAYEVTGGA